jgi:hypothetical protein
VSVAETPVFTEVTQQRKPLKAPVLDAICRHPRSFLVVIGSRMAENGLGYRRRVTAVRHVAKYLARRVDNYRPQIDYSAKPRWIDNAARTARSASC